MLAAFYWMAACSTTTGRIPILFAGGFWACGLLRDGITDVPVASELRICLTSLEGVLGTMLAELYPMADLSTPTPPITILFARGC